MLMEDDSTKIDESSVRFSNYTKTTLPEGKMKVTAILAPLSEDHGRMLCCHSEQSDYNYTMEEVCYNLYVDGST